MVNGNGLLLKQMCQARKETETETTRYKKHNEFYQDDDNVYLDFM